MQDFRLWTAVFFGLLGGLLIGTGLAAPELRAPLATTNVNLAGGALMLGFGGVLLWFSRRKA